jgi:hypothetical protein
MSEAEAQPIVEEETAPSELSTEDERVLRWRYEEIRKLGMNRVESRLLAEAGADLNLLRKLVGDGCPPELAVRIAL